MKRLFFPLLILLMIVNLVFIVQTPVMGEETMEKPEYMSLELAKPGDEGSYMVKLRDIATYFGWNLGYDGEEKVVTIRNGDKQAVVKIGSDQFMEKETEIVSPVLNGGRTYIDLELVSQLQTELVEEQELDLIIGLLVEEQKFEAGKTVETEIVVYNVGQELVNLKYRSGQLYDLILLKKAEEIWRWSEGKMFTMALMSRDLEPDEILRYEEEVPLEKDLAAGEYVLTGKIATEIPLEFPEVKLNID